ncbi:uncharacterized protein LOC113232117 [Hyposmocoma kahamanoa]|uniref:uncharacterized protein LOC113232117 n=1 Tax=Hyposmocoma kahamanoa TaxID=1477025 RepID=UPI000E6D607E|nr:uncharacterized protein LOC113232117 [Hyposmocoma kahamanoa]
MEGSSGVRRALHLELGDHCVSLLGSEECPEGTHSYSLGCDFLVPEATCENPKPKADTRVMLCDYSACYCDEPTVRDTASNKCVPLDQCPKKEYDLLKFHVQLLNLVRRNKLFCSYKFSRVIFTMKLLVALCVFVVIGFATAKPHERGCIYIMGKCSQECPEGTHSYSLGCDYLVPEATCENPEPKADTRGMFCDFSACYCDEPTVRDKASNKCVPLDQCPKTE